MKTMIIKALKKLFSPLVIASDDDVVRVLESRSAYFVQKSMTEYTQARANMMFSTLLGEKGFQDAYEKGRFSAFPAGLAMVSEILCGRLRDAGVEGGEAKSMVMAAATKIVEPYPHASMFDAAFWAEAVAGIERALARSLLAAPHASHHVVKERAAEIFKALPIHSSVKRYDFEMFESTLAFHLTEIATELEEAKISLK